MKVAPGRLWLRGRRWNQPGDDDSAYGSVFYGALECAVKLKRSHIITALVLVVFGVVWARGFWFNEVFHSHKSNVPNRKALLEIRERIGIGASQAEVLSAYWQHRTDVLRLFADRPTDWIITMPLEFGASDWNMRIEFKDGRVTAVRVRTSDGPQPKDGPMDKL